MNDVWERELENLLKEDISSVRERERTAFDRLVSPFGNSIVIFGAGNLGRKISERLRKDGVEPLAFTDNNSKAWGNLIDGISVLSPSDAAKKFGKVAAFVVAIWSPGSHHRYPETAKKLREFGCIKVVSFVSFFWKYASDFLPNCFMDLPHKTYSNNEDIKKAFRLMADEESRENFITQLKWRMIESYDELPASTSEIQYFPKHLFTYSKEEVFIDCGAFDGDTILEYTRLVDSNFSRIFAFEPDPINFGKLHDYVDTLRVEIKTKITLEQKATGKQKETLSFFTTGTASSVISREGATVIESISIDEALQQQNPTYIKMDIEGSEIDALLGAQKSIENNLPVLAICVYHRPDHLWKIPLLIHSMSDQYHFFLKAHQEEGWDLVCYAIPTTRLEI